MSSRWSEFPFSPRKLPFFYGWVILAASTLGILASIPGQTMGVGVFTEDLIEALGLSRTQLSTSYALGTIASSFLLPYAGTLLDRFGGRIMAVIASLGTGGSLVLLAVSDRIAGVLSVAGFAFFVSFCCFLGLRFFGQGALSMVPRVMIGRWFNHRRGLATAISSVFVSFGFNGSPQLINWLIQTLGWRAAALIMAAAVGLGMSFIGWLLFRDNPEECGLAMDGVDDPAWHAKMIARVPETRHEFTRAEALRTPGFWVFNAAVASQGLIVTALTFHVASMGAEMGMSRSEAFSIFLPMSFFGVAATFLGGWTSDRMRLKYLLYVMMAMQALGTAGLLSFHEPVGRALLTVGYGTAGGLFAILITVVWPRFYGRKHLGAISGANMSIMVFASALGPVFFSTMRGWTGSYTEVILICWLMPLIILVSGLWADNPQEKAVLE